MVKSRLYARIPCMIVGAALLSACAGTSNPWQGSSNPDERVLGEYSAEYVATGALVGAAGGAILGCVLGEIIGSDCGTWALVGGGAGALAGGVYGYSVAEDTAQYASVQERVQVQQGAAQEELNAARRARAAAQRLVNRELTTLKSLRTNLAANQISAVTAENQLEQAQVLQEQLQVASARIQGSIDAMNEDIAAAQRGGVPPQALIQNRNALQQEKRQLDEELQNLTREIDITDDLLS